MFESIVFRNRVGPGNSIDVGALAEAMIFYDRVSVVGNSATLQSLLDQIPPMIFYRLIDQGRLEFHYVEQQFGIRSTAPVGGPKVHELVGFSSPDHTLEKAATKEFVRALGGVGNAKVIASKFAKRAHVFEYPEFNLEPLRQSLLGPTTELTVLNLLRELVPAASVPSDAKFAVVPHSAPGRFTVETNLDFGAINSEYHKIIPPAHSSITPEYLLAIIEGAYETSYIAAAIESEVAVGEVERAIQTAAMNALVEKRFGSQIQIDAFSSLTLDSAAAIREAINSGKVPFVELIKVLDRADKFRDWLKKQPADAELVRSFYRSTVEDTWVEKLPGKATKWGVFGAAGLGLDALLTGGLATAAAVTLSVLDTFVVDKLVGGWKPHQFVESELRPRFAVKE